MSSLPYDHAYAAIHRIGGDIVEYVDDFFKLKTQEMIYSNVLHTLVTYDMPPM